MGSLGIHSRFSSTPNLPAGGDFPAFAAMTGHRGDTSTTRRRAIAVIGGTVAAGGLAVERHSVGHFGVRKDITRGKAGVPLTLRLTVADALGGCTPLSGAAVETCRAALPHGPCGRGPQALSRTFPKASNASGYARSRGVP